MKKTVLNNLPNSLINNYAIRTESHEEIDYIIVPVVMMVEGVHSGSRGPILYTTSELEQSASAWNGFPVIVNHPTDENGNYISAADTTQEQIVGTIQNSHMDGSKLKADLRIDITSLGNMSQETLGSIRNQSPLDVSIGVFTDDEEVSGEFNNITYNAIAHNLTPDHLALLPGAVGACSFDAGCGIRNQKSEVKVNKSQTKIKINEGVERTKLTFKQLHALLLKEGCVINELGNSELTRNELGFYEISNAIQNKLDAFDGENKYYYLQEAFTDGTFVYMVRNRDDRTSLLYRRTYQVNEDDQITLLDDAVVVVREVNYKVVAPNLNKFVRTKKVKEIMTNEKVSSCKVDALIVNKASKFTEDDREFLSGLDEPMFNKLAPDEEKKLEVNKKVEEVPVVDTKEVIANAIKAFFAEQKTPEAFIDLMPKGLGDQMKSGLKLHNDRVSILINGIVANSKFTEATLKTWENDTLEIMYNSVMPEEVDFTGIGEVRNLNNNKESGGTALRSMVRLDEEPKKKEA